MSPGPLSNVGSWPGWGIPPSCLHICPRGPGAQAVALSPSPTGGSKQGAPGAVAPRGSQLAPVGPPRPVDTVTVDTKSHCRTGVPALSPEVFQSPSASPALHLGTLGPLPDPPQHPQTAQLHPLALFLSVARRHSGLVSWVGSLCFLGCGRAGSTRDVCMQATSGRPSSCRSDPSPGSALCSCCVC